MPVPRKICFFLAQAWRKLKRHAHAGGALQQHRNLDIPLAAQVWLRTNPAKSSKFFRARFAQDPRKHRARQPVFIKGTSASNHSCIIPAKASLSPLSQAEFAFAPCFLSVHKPCNSHHSTPTQPYSTTCCRACNITAQETS